MPALAAALACFLALTAAAHAQLSDPLGTLQNAQENAQQVLQDPQGASKDPGEYTDIDTGLTPVAKPSQLWQQIAGAPFGSSKPINAITSSRADLYDVAFYDEANGLAGGAQCADPEADPDDCTPRVPVLYRYTERPNEDPVWERIALPGAEREGYIGAIAWIGPDRALAVGGDGEYSKREPDFDPLDPSGEQSDPAGMARAWLYENGVWRELRNPPDGSEGDEIPDAMRGLSALAFAKPDEGKPSACPESPEEKGEEGEEPEPIACGVVGAYRQLWFWRDEGFDFTEYSSHSSEPEVEDAGLWRFRVRDVQFVPPPTGSPEIVAVTSGCCAESPAKDFGRAIVWQGGRWHVRLLYRDPADATNEGDAHKSLRPLDAGPRQTLADSNYSLTLLPRTASDEGRFSVVTAPGGPSERYALEPHSSVTAVRPLPTGSPGIRASTLVGDAIQFPLKSLEYPGTLVKDAQSSQRASYRLVSADGNLDCTGMCITNSRGRPDWAVGSIRRTRQAAAYFTPDEGASTIPSTPTLGSPCPLPSADPDQGKIDISPPDPECEVEQFFGDNASKALFKLPSWSLNSIDMVGETGIGWAVGDRGAILKLDDRVRAGRMPSSSTPPEPPKLVRERTPLSRRDQYEDKAPPLARAVGPVPPLGFEGIERLDEPRFVPAGSPDPAGGNTEVSSIVTSRDGGEGWAFGGADLYHLENGRWSICDPQGIPGLVPPDRACAGIAVQARAGARVPLELDSDPTNDEEFEVVAVGGGGTVWRYQRGRWAVDQQATAVTSQPVPPSGALTLRSVEFTAPDDGWVMGYEDGPILRLFHFNGESWIDCKAAESNPAHPCGDIESRIPYDNEVESSSLTTNTGLGLTAAGSRVYLYGTRATAALGPTQSADNPSPMIIYRDRGPCNRGGDPGCWRAVGGGYDPGFDDPQNERERGRVLSLAVAARGDGSYEGWAVGQFGLPSGSGGLHVSAGTVGGRGRDVRKVERAAGAKPFEAAVLRLDPGARLRRWQAGDAADDYLFEPSAFDPDPRNWPNRVPRLSLALPGTGDEMGAAVLAPINRPMLAFTPERERWEALATPWWPIQRGFPNPELQGEVRALAADGQGGFWAAVRQSYGGLPHRVWFYHYTDVAPRPVFDSVPHPVRERITTAAGGADGSFWVGTPTGMLYRHDRLTGWDGVRIEGWDPKRTTTRTPVNDIALGPDGKGVAVGPYGHIADLAPDIVQIDAANGTVCDKFFNVPPCGTGQNLTDVSVAADGSAMAIGGDLTILWRPAGGEFRRAAPPELPRSTPLTDVSMPTPGRAWLTTGEGQVVAGTLDASGGWRWEVENLDGEGGLLTLSGGVNPLGLSAIAIDSEGRGYAVGDQGLILERTGNAEQPWRRVPSHTTEGLGTLALPAGEGEGALIGGGHGMVLTDAGRGIEVAREGDQFSPGGSLGGWSGVGIAGLALLPGSEDGQVEAWAAVQSRGREDILHYASDPSEPLLQPAGRAQPLPDSPPPREGEISLAAFGKSDCPLLENSASGSCSEITGASLAHEVITQHIAQEIKERSEEPDGPPFAVFTGDVNDAAGAGNEPTATPTDPAYAVRRWNELISDPLRRAGVPVFAALGGQDLSQTQVCGPAVLVNCRNTRAIDTGFLGNARVGLGSGLNLPWRHAMAGMPAPWGGGEPAQSGSLSFEPVPESTLSVPVEEVELDPDGEGPLPSARPRTGGAATHYALDVTDAESGEALMRVVFVDTSLRSLAPSDPFQQPFEPAGQAAWLESVLCTRDTQSDPTRLCSREPGEPAVVVTSTPTYSYAANSPEELQTDPASFEALLMRHRVAAVISGHLGWNGLYWALAPGLHHPCPGGEYQARPPAPGAGPCDAPGGGNLPTGDPSELATELDGASGLLPFVVASGAGGKFNALANQSGATEASDGYWHGYTLVRVDASGDPRKLVVEQRPVFDWVGISGSTHVLEEREKLSLEGFGREPFGADQPIRYDEIATPAITHRYDLLLADPEEPWLACLASDASCATLHSRLSAPPQARGSGLASQHGGAAGSATAAMQDLTPSDTCAPYLCLPERIGSIDSETGALKAGDGRYRDTFAIATLSVGDRVATYPLVFQRSPAFIVNPATARTPSASLSASGSVPAPPPPPQPPQPQTPQLNPLQQPTLPALTPLSATQPPEPQPPTPPTPPPPAEQPSPLDLTVSPTALTVATPAAVIQPPTPPVNPAPPSGARREARQRQAATQKSGADSAPEDQQVDTADKPYAGPGNAMSRHEAARQEHGFSRHDRARPAPSFTPLVHAEPSAGAQALLYTGGATLLAAALALGFTTLRPGPRRRPPEVPAPAWARARHRHLR